MAIGAGIRRSIGSYYYGNGTGYLLDHPFFLQTWRAHPCLFETSITLQIHYDHSTSHATDSTVAEVFGLLGNIIDLSPIEFHQASDYQHAFSHQDWKVLFVRKLGNGK